MKIACLNCGRPYPESGVPYICPRCGGLFDDIEPLAWFEPERSQPGIWRYRRTLQSEAGGISLGEGNTALVSSRVDGRHIYFKCEYANPTGAF
jgi:threonine synthase